MWCCGERSPLPPNCGKRLTKRRLVARADIAALEESTLGGRHAALQIRLKMGRRRAAVSVAVFSRFAIYATVVSRTGDLSSQLRGPLRARRTSRLKPTSIAKPICVGGPRRPKLCCEASNFPQVRVACGCVTEGVCRDNYRQLSHWPAFTRNCHPWSSTDYT